MSEGTNENLITIIFAKKKKKKPTNRSEPMPSPDDPNPDGEQGGGMDFRIKISRKLLEEMKKKGRRKIFVKQVGGDLLQDIEIKF